MIDKYRNQAYGYISYETEGATMSESLSAGASWRMRILVGARIVLTTRMSGTAEPARDGAAEAVKDEAAFEDLDLPDLPSEGADIDTEDNFGKATLCLSSPFFACVAAEAYSDSFSPTHERANQRPPAIPRISRLAIRQCRTFFPVLSRGITGAEPVGIFKGG